MVAMAGERVSGKEKKLIAGKLEKPIIRTQAGIQRLDFSGFPLSRERRITVISRRPTGCAARISLSRGLREPAKASTSPCTGIGLIDTQQQLRFAFG